MIATSAGAPTLSVPRSSKDGNTPAALTVAHAIIWLSGMPNMMNFDITFGKSMTPVVFDMTFQSVEMVRQIPGMRPGLIFDFRAPSRQGPLAHAGTRGIPSDGRCRAGPLICLGRAGDACARRQRQNGSAGFQLSSFEMRWTVRVPIPSDLATFKMPM